MARWILRASIVASVLLIVAHFAYAATTFRRVTLESVQFAELGLPLLFAAFLNGVVWSDPERAVAARAARACWPNGRDAARRCPRRPPAQPDEALQPTD